MSCLFSIITPVYNARKTIYRCVTSVIDQLEKDFEYIIIDDGSTDGSINEIKSILEKTYVKLVRVPNGGVSAARNIGLKQACGEYIIFLDADDELTPDALSTYKEYINQYNTPDVLFSGFYKVYPKKKTSFSLFHNEKALAYNADFKEFNPYIARLIGTVWGKCYKKSLIREDQFSEKLKLCEDAEFNYRIFERAKNFLYVNANTYRYYYSMTSTIRQFNPGYIKMYVAAIEKIKQNAGTKLSIQSANEFACTVLNVICFNVIFTKQNDNSLRVKIEEVKSTCEKTVFSDVLTQVDKKSLSLRHRIPIFILGNRHYVLLPLLATMKSMLNSLLY